MVMLAGAGWRSQGGDRVMVVEKADVRHSWVQGCRGGRCWVWCLVDGIKRTNVAMKDSFNLRLPFPPGS